MKTTITALDTEKSYSPFSFPGFWQEGECDLTAHIRRQSIVFVCSQRLEYYGTSVTNAIEVIRQKAIEQIVDDGLLKADASKTLLERMFLTQAKVERALRFAARAFVLKNSTWIEHYPEGTGIAYEDSYSIVHFSAVGEPAWSYVTIETLEKRFPGIPFPRREET